MVCCWGCMQHNGKREENDSVEQKFFNDVGYNSKTASFRCDPRRMLHQDSFLWYQELISSIIIDRIKWQSQQDSHIKKNMVHNLIP